MSVHDLVDWQPKPLAAWVARVVVATTAAMTANFAVWQQILTGALGFITLLAGTVTAVFTCLIVIRRWYRGFKIEKYIKEL